MGRPGRRPDRLAKLAEELGVSIDEPTSGLARPLLPTTTADEANKVLETLVKSNRGLRRATMVLKLFGQDFSTAWSHISDRESKATMALQYMFRENIDQYSAGEVLMLVRLGADVNEDPHSRVLMRESMKGKTVKRSSLPPPPALGDTMFERAVTSGKVDLVNVLAESASPLSLKKGLKIAISKRNADILRILMARGANPNDGVDELQKAVDLGDYDILLIACSGKIPLADQFLTSYLYHMLRLRKTDVARRLLAYGANADVQSPSALQYAIDASRAADVLTLCLAKKAPTPHHLARGVASIWHATEDARTRLQLVEILLAGGAEGDGVSESLVTATSKGDRAMVKLILSYCQPNSSISSEALKTAMRISNYFLFLIHLDMVEDQNVLGETLAELLTTPLWYNVSEKHRVRMAAVLIEKKVPKNALGKALNAAVDHGEIELVRLLIGRGASVEHESGLAVVIAIQRGSMEMLTMLLDTEPHPADLTNAMNYVTELPMNDRLTWTRLLVESNPKQSDIDHALAQSIQKGPGTETNYELMKVLLSNSGTISVGDNSCLVAAVEAGDIQAVKLLFPWVPMSSNLSTALDATNSIRDLDNRYRILELLLDAKPGNVAVTNTLIKVLDLIPRETRFSRLLVACGRLNVNQSDGRVVVQAVTHQDVELVRFLVKKSPTPATLSIALRTAMTTQQGKARVAICQILTSAGASGVEVDQALLRASVTYPADIDLVKLFLASAASIDHKSGSVVILAIERSDMEVLNLLLDRPAKEETMVRAFEHAQKLKNPDRKLAALRALKGARTKLPVNLSKKLDDEIWNGMNG